MSILSVMQDIQSKFEEIKPDFEVYITNQTISLDERWAVFSAAPSEMKEHSHYNNHFRTIPYDFIMSGGPVHMEQGQTMDSVTLIRYIEEKLQEIKTDNFFGADWHQSVLKEINVNELKEEIMAKNLGSFEYNF